MERFGANKIPPLSKSYVWQRGDIRSFGSGDLSAEDGQRTADAVWVPGGAAVSSKQDDPVTKIAALFRRKDSAELMLHLFRILSLGKS